jgi:hypothetical protein
VSFFGRQQRRRTFALRKPAAIHKSLKTITQADVTLGDGREFRNIREFR